LTQKANFIRNNCKN